MYNYTSFSQIRLLHRLRLLIGSSMLYRISLCLNDVSAESYNIFSTCNALLSVFFKARNNTKWHQVSFAALWTMEGNAILLSLRFLIFRCYVVLRKLASQEAALSFPFNKKCWIVSINEVSTCIKHLNLLWT